MPKVSIFDREGGQVGDLDLMEGVFAAEIKPGLMHDAVVAQLRGKRQGTSSTKTRNEVKGGGRKPWRQKGTGRARHGSIRSPIWVGGGITFGPKPKEYRNRLPKKVKKQALRSAFSAKVAEEKFLVLDQLSLEAPRTKNVISLLQNLKLEGEKVLLLIADRDENIYKSARNIPGVKTMIASAINIFDLLNHEYIVATKDAVSLVEEVLTP